MITLTQLQVDELATKLIDLAEDPEETTARECLRMIDGLIINPATPTHAEYMAEELDDAALVIEDDLGMFPEETPRRVALMRSFRGAAKKIRAGSPA